MMHTITDIQVGKQPYSFGIELLGPPKITRDGHSVTLTRRQLRALLFLLASTPNPVPREHITFMFWTNHPEPIARRRLTKLLTHLRRDISPFHLDETSDMIALPNSIWCDVREFNLVTRNAATMNAQQLEQSVKLYRGPFLDGFSLNGCSEYEYWISSERSHQEQQYLYLLSVLIRKLSLDGMYKAAIDYSRRYLELDELAEDIHCKLMILFGRDGDRNAALEQFKICQSVLQRELGVEPLAETVAIYDQIRSGLRISLPYQQDTKQVIHRSLLHTHFVGREGEKRLLHNVLRETSISQQVHAILLHGEKGIGKTALLNAFKAEIPPDTCVLNISAHISTRHKPLYGLQKILEVVHSQTCQQEISWNDADPVNSKMADNIIRNLYRILQDFSRVILAIEDLHFLDLETIAEIPYILRECQTLPILLIGSYCCQAQGRIVTFRTALESSVSLTQDYEVPPLKEDAIGVLAANILQLPSLDANSCTGLLYLSGGNPMLLQEILQYMVDHKLTVNGFLEQTTSAITSNILNMIMMRLDNLQPITKQVLEASVFLDPDITFDKLKFVSGRRPEEVHDALQELEAKCIIYPLPGKYSFRHQILLNVVRDHISPARFTLLQQRYESTVP